MAQLKTEMQSSGIEAIDREDFIINYFDYHPGEHLTIVGPTHRGKTTLGFQLLHEVANPRLKGVVLASKPRDKAVDEFRKRAKGFRLVETWDPPSEWYWNKNKRDGYILHPYQSLKDVDKDNANVRHHFKNAIYDCYGSTDARILFVDEAHEVQEELKLKKELQATLKRGSSLGCGTWSLIQRTAYNTYDMYNAPTHLVLFNDPDKKNRQRFAQIGGGIDPDFIEDTVNGLGQYEAFYIKRTGPDGPSFCIINP